MRFDPFYDGLWEAGANATWVSKQAADRQAASGLATVPQHLSMPADAAWDRVFGHLPKQLRALSAPNMWHTVSAEQLAAIAGVPAIATGRSPHMAALFTLGLVDVGHVNMVITTGKAARGTTQYRPSATDSLEKRLFPQLKYAERVAVTPGVPLGSASRYDRHNLLATELALRVSECCEIGTVLGEKLSTADMLTGAGIGYPPVVGTTRAAEATLVRTDGARIAIELTASTGERFEAKVRKWAKDLSRIRMNDSGLIVLFVIAQRPEGKSRAGDPRTKVLQTIARGCAAYPGVAFDRTAARMLVADWAEWFPASGVVSVSFLSLDGLRPTGDSGTLWEHASTLDIIDSPFQPTTPDNALAILHNANGLGGVPHWLRTGPGPELWRIAIRDAGFKRTPVVAPAHAGARAGLELGAARGVAGKARPPQRLAAPLAGHNQDLHEGVGARSPRNPTDAAHNPDMDANHQIRSDDHEMQPPAEPAGSASQNAHAGAPRKPGLDTRTQSRQKSSIPTGPFRRVPTDEYTATPGPAAETTRSWTCARTADRPAGPPSWDARLTFSFH